MADADRPTGTLPQLERRDATIGRLSYTQEAVWLHGDGRASTYHVPLLLRWRARVDVDVLAQALALLAGRHAILRTTYRFDAVAGWPVQLTRESVEVPITVVGDGPPARADLDAQAQRVFSLADEPPLRCAVWRGSTDGDTVLLTIHHIAIDGWSLAPLFEELSTAYQALATGREPRLPPVELQYLDYAT
jgi:NRPS condensation-like uncharacterized protein